MSGILVTSSCGCIFCDLGLPPTSGFHFGPANEIIECPLTLIEHSAGPVTWSFCNQIKPPDADNDNSRTVKA